jgi:hypothetical protein
VAMGRQDIPNAFTARPVSDMDSRSQKTDWRSH